MQEELIYFLREAQNQVTRTREALKQLDYITPDLTVSTKQTVVRLPALQVSTDLLKPELSQLRVFLCYSQEDKSKVLKIYEYLKTQTNLIPWVDEKDLMPGQVKEQEIIKQLRKSDIILLCISEAFIREEGITQKEIKIALDLAREKPTDSIFIVPIKLEDCEIPDDLNHLECVNFFDENCYAKLMRTLNYCVANKPIVAA